VGCRPALASGPAAAHSTSPRSRSPTGGPRLSSPTFSRDQAGHEPELESRPRRPSAAPAPPSYACTPRQGMASAPFKVPLPVPETLAWPPLTVCAAALGAEPSAAAAGGIPIAPHIPYTGELIYVSLSSSSFNSVTHLSL
jgi:hypothetical protein